MKKLAAVLLFVVASGMFAQSRVLVPRNTEVVPTPRFGMGGIDVPADNPFDSWTITATTRDDRPWGDPAWIEHVGAESGTIPVRVWRYRSSSVCAVQTVEVAASPGATISFTIDQSKFKVGDVLMLEHSPAMDTHLVIQSFASIETDIVFATDRPVVVTGNVLVVSCDQ
jgi:hypothetical protein